MEKIYYEQPDDFHDAIHVSGCYCDYDGKLLLLKRATHKPSPETWGVPAGKQDPGETNEETVIREVYEEVGITLNKNKIIYFNTMWVRLTNIKYVFHMFYASFSKCPPILLNEQEHSEYIWVTLEEAKTLPLIFGGNEAISLFADYKLTITPF